MKRRRRIRSRGSGTDTDSLSDTTYTIVPKRSFKATMWHAVSQDYSYLLGSYNRFQTDKSARVSINSFTIANSADLSLLASATPLSSGSANSSKVFLKSVTVRTVFKNPSSHSVKMTLYEVEPRFDIAQSNPDVNNVATAVYKSIANNTTIVNFSSDYPDVLSMPLSTDIFQCELFTNAFIVKRSFNIELTPGKVHTHTQTYGFNFCPNPSRYIHAVYVKGLSKMLMVRTEGVPVYVTANSAGTAVNAETLTIPVVDAVRSVTYSYAYVTPNYTVTYGSPINNGLTTRTRAQILGDQFIDTNPVTGQNEGNSGTTDTSVNSVGMDGFT